jgi:hypothetical protein
MARAIDGDALKRWCEKIIDQACHPATVQIGEVFLDKVRSMPTLTPPNEPLTIEQLREMDGEPVWIANPDALEYGRWGIVDGVYQAEDDQVLMLRGDYSCHYYGKTWLAYRRPSEGEENAQ